MNFKNKNCDNIFHGGLFFFTALLIASVVTLFFAPVVATWIALSAVIPIFFMLGAGIAERKLSGVPFFQKRERKPEKEKHQEEDLKQEKEEELEEEIEEEIEEELEDKQEKVHEMGSLSTPVEEKIVEPVVKEVAEPKVPKATKKTR